MPVAEADQGVKLGMHSGLFQHFPHHSVGQMLPGQYCSARQFVEGGLAPLAMPLADHQQVPVFAQHHAAGANVMRGVGWDMGVWDQPPGQHQVICAGVMEFKTGRHRHWDQRRFTDGHLQPNQTQAFRLPGGYRWE